MFNFAPKPQSIPRIFSDSTKLFKNTFLKIWPWQLLWLLPFLIISLTENDPTLANKVSALDYTHLTIIGLAIALPLLLLPLFGYLFNIHRIYNLVTQPALTVGYSLKTALKKILPALGATLLILFAPLVIGVLGVLLKFVSLPFFLIVMALLIIPLLLAVLFAFFLITFYLQLIVLDNYGAFKSIKESCKLVWGNWWRNFTVLIGLTLIQIFFSSLSVLIPNPVLSIVVNVIILSIIYPWSFSVLLVQFNDLKMRQQRKTSLDIQGS